MALAVQGFSALARDFAQKQWDGSPLEGRTVLLHAERGFGDTLQFIRFVPQVIEAGGKIVVECQPALQRLLQGMPECAAAGAARFVAAGV